MANIDTAFLILLVLVLGALGVANFIESQSKGQKQVGQGFFGLLYLVFAVGLIIYKIQNP